MMTVADFKRLVRLAERADDPRAVAVFYTLFMTGMRVSEMLQLRLEDVKENIVSVKGKGTKYRDVFIPIKLKKAHAHNFRHLCALEMIRNGLSISEVADILGHSDINVTRIYTRKTKKQLLKAINKM